MNIIIGADIVPTETNTEAFESGDLTTLVGEELKHFLEKADYRIFNLEVPLTNRITPIFKCGEAMAAPTKCINAIKLLNINLFTLSNNHIMDQDVQGLISTLTILDNVNIAHTGAGLSLQEAMKPCCFVCDGKKIGVYACTEHEFSIAGEHIPGANPIDYLDSFDHVKKLKEESDFVIVLYHGGKEHYRYPSPQLQRCCRKMIAYGADLVVCQHSHCIGAKETYKNGTIVYGQGNFIFDGSDSEYWRTSLLIQICDDFKIKYYPLQKRRNGVRLAEKELGRKILSDFYRRSCEIEKPEKVEELYNSFAEEYLSEFLSVASGKKYSTLFRAVNKLVGNNALIKKYIQRRYSVNKRLTLLNRIECEAYNELFIKALKLSIERMKEK